MVSRTPFIEMHNQMKTIHHTSYALAVLLLVATALAGCRDSFSDRDLPTPAQTETGAPDGTIEVRLPYAAPLMSTPTNLRAMTPADECAIDATRSRLFVFKSDGKLLYEAPITSVRADGEGKGEYDQGTVTAFLKEGDKLKLALYANLDPAQMKIKVTTDMTRKEISELFTFALSTETPARLPMWGELEVDKVSHTLATKGANAVQTITTGPIKMLRSVARIDVGLNLSGDAFEEEARELKGKVPSATGTAEATYTLASVEVVNVSLSNTVAPHASVYDKKKNQVTGLYNGTSITHTSKLTYGTISDNALLRDIYVAETPNPKSDTMKGADGRMSHEEDDEYAKRPYLIIGLKHSLDKKERFFRIDFLTSAKKNDDDPEVTADGKLHYDYIDLLRNHRYLVNILKVDGLGYETKEEAAKYSAANIAYNVLVLDETKIGDVMYDGQHTLAVTQDEFAVGKYGSRPDYFVKTTWPDGWVIEVPKMIPGTESESNSLWSDKELDHAGWIDFSTTEGRANKEMQVIQSIKANDTSEDRTGYFYVRAGRMRWLITVHQSSKSDLRISLWADPEATKPLQYVELHQDGARVGEALGGYHRVYVKTDPYIDPKDAATLEEIYTKLYPILGEMGRDQMLAWDFGNNYNSSSTSPEEATLKDPTSSSWVRFSDTSRGTTHHFFRYTGNHNVWELIVSAEPMVDMLDPFELKTNEYIAVLTDDTDRAEANLRIEQREYSVEPYVDSDGVSEAIDLVSSQYWDGTSLTERITTTNHLAFVRDGKEKVFYMSANLPYRLTIGSIQGGKFVPATSEADLKKIGVDKFGTLTDGKFILEEREPERIGRATHFTARKVAAGTGKAEIAFYVESLIDGRIKPYVFTAELVDAVIQREANCYLIKASAKQGILIPASRVNTAADYYNRMVREDRGNPSYAFPRGNFDLNRLAEDDEYEPYVIWTDMGRPAGRKADGTYDYTGGGIKRLERVRGAGPDSYIYVESSGKIGNALIGIRSKKIPGNPTLWSWHIWVVDDYPKAIQTTVLHNEQNGDWDPYKQNYPANLWTMSRLIGASTEPAEEGARRYTDYGFLYQAGRKDPFPSWKEVVPYVKDRNVLGVDKYPIGIDWEGERVDPKPFWDGEGKRFFFELHVRGDRNNAGARNPLLARGATMTMRESIEDPARCVAHQSIWLYENTPFFKELGEDLINRKTYQNLWENAYEKVTYESGLRAGAKTVFDPSPYGWRIPKFREAQHLLGAYIHGWLKSPRPSFLYDGSYTFLQTQLAFGDNVKDDKRFHNSIFFYCAEGRYDAHPLFYLNNVGGWTKTTSGSLGESVYRRACAFSIRPVIDSTEDDYKDYLPQ